MSTLLPRPPASGLDTLPNPVALKDNSLELAASVSGSLCLYACGFLGRHEYEDAQSISSAGEISLELTQFPDSTRKSTPNGTVEHCRGDISYSALWETKMTCTMVFSFQQLRVAHMRMALSCAVTSPVPGRRVFGESELDASSLVSFGSKPVVFVVPVYAPRRSSERRKFSDVSKLCGWVLMGCGFVADDGDVNAAWDLVQTVVKGSWLRILGEPKLASSIGWLKEVPLAPAHAAAAQAGAGAGASAGSGATATATAAIGTDEKVPETEADTEQVHLDVDNAAVAGVSGHSPLATSTPSPVPLPLQLPPTSQVHLAFGRLQGIAQVVDECLSGGGSVRLEARIEGSERANVSSSNHVTAVEMVATTENGLRSCGWKSGDMITSFVTTGQTGQGQLSPLIHFYLIARQGGGGGGAGGMVTGTGTEADTILGESVCMVPAQDLRLGVPLNTRVSLRDTSGNRLLLVTVGFQNTSISSDHTAGAGPSATSTSPSGTNDNNNPSTYSAFDLAEQANANIRVKVNIIDGSITDPNWRANLEPFFELSILAPTPGGAAAAAAAAYGHTQTPFNPVLSCRTRFLNFSNNKEQWNIEHFLGLQIESLPRSSVEESQMQPFSLVIVCRDAARFMCAEIGWAKISLPWSLLSRGRVLDQWVTFSPSRGGSSNGAGSSQSKAKSAGRIRIRITKCDDPAATSPLALPTVTAKDDNTRTQPGIGTVVMWLRGVFESGPGNMQERVNVSLATASASVVLSGDKATRNDMDGDSATFEDGNGRLYSEVAMTVDEPLDKSMARSASSNNTNLSQQPNTTVSKGAVGEGVFCQWASLPVSGGRCTEVSLRIALDGNIVPFSTSFAVMQAINPYIEVENVNVKPSIPQLQLLLHDSTSAMTATLPTSTLGNTGTATISAPRRSKKPPMLRLDSAFVPFVCGSLVVALGSIQMTSWANARFASTPNNTTRRAALRYVMGARTYGYSNEFSVSTKGKMNTFGGNQRSNVIALPVNTLLETYKIDGGSSFELQVYLLDLDCAENSSSGGAGGGGGGGSGAYCMGVGSIQTAALYYLAMRCAASSSMPANTYTSTTSAQSHSTDKEASAAATAMVGLSPWLQEEVQFVDPIMHTIVAVASLSVQFAFDGVCTPVVHLLNRATATVTSDGEARARTELGLKQTFLLADTDRSGSVSQMELMKVIKSSGPVKRRGARPVNTLVGMENAVELLLGLANSTSNSLANESAPVELTAEQLDDEVKQIFKRLDVDGDGSVSWWEWQCVLCAALNGRNQEYVFVDPSETLCIGVKAAHNAIVAHTADSLRDLSGIMRVVPYARPALTDTSSNENNNDDDVSLSWLRPGKECYDDSGLLAAQDPLKSVEKLHAIVKNLRSANTTLCSRLERALASGAGGGLSATAPAALATEKQGAQTQPFDRSLSYFSINRNQLSPTNTQLVANNALVGTLGADFKTDREAQLEQEIARLKEKIALNNQLKTDKQTSNQNIRSKLVDEVERRKREIEEAQRMRVLKMKAMVTVVVALKRYLLPKHRKKVYQRNMARIGQLLQVAVARFKFLKLRKRRRAASVMIQALARGNKDRTKQDKLKRMVITIQRVFRGHQARKVAQQERRTAQLLQRARAAAAATLIQSMSRRKQAKKELDSRRATKKKVQRVGMLQGQWRKMQAQRQLATLRADRDRENALQGNYLRAVAVLRVHLKDYVRRRRAWKNGWTLRSNIAAIELQRHVRGFVARSKYNRHVSQKKQQAAAVRLQALHRGRGGRRRVVEIKTSIATRMFLLESFDAVEKNARRRDRPHMEDIVNKIVRFFFATNGDYNHMITDSSNHHIDPEDNDFVRVGNYWGRVSGVDPMLRLVHISFFDKVKVSLFPQHIPFDHPQLEWFAMPDDDFSHDAVVDLVEEESPELIDPSEEEQRRLASVRVIQKYIRGALTRLKVYRTKVTKYWINLQKLFHDSLSNMWTRVTRPTIELCQMYIVRIVETYMLPGCKYNCFVWGRIQAVNMEEAELMLELFDPNKLSIRVVRLPFNSPALEWYKAPMLTHKYNESTKQPALSMRRNSALNALVGHSVRDDVVEAKEVEKPGIENVTDGFYVSISVNGNIEKCGQVLCIDALTRILRVVFYVDGVETIEDVPYDHPFLAWYKEVMSTAARPLPFRPKLIRSLGFEVCITDGQGQVLDRGKVCAFDPEHNKITIRYYANTRFNSNSDALGQRHASSVLDAHKRDPTKKDAVAFHDLMEARKRILTEDYDFDDVRLVWIHSMRYESRVVRPPLALARGFTVHVRADMDGHGLGFEFYAGIVHAIHKDDNSIDIRYEVDTTVKKSSKSLKGQAAAVVNDPVVEAIDFDSPDIAWVCGPVVVFDRSTVERPPIEHAMGYGVEVASMLPDSVEGDFFQGEVTHINIAKRTITIRFQSSGDEVDEEVFPYDSLDVAWMYQPEPWINDRVARPELKDAVGYGVALRKHNYTQYTAAGEEVPVNVGAAVFRTSSGEGQVDYWEGVVQFVDVRAGTLSILLARDADADEYDDVPITQIAHYDSRDVAWMTQPPPKGRSQCPKPAFSASKGYVVQVRKEVKNNKFALKPKTTIASPAAAQDDPENVEYIKGVVVTLKGSNLLGIRLANADLAQTHAHASAHSHGYTTSHEMVHAQTSLKFYSYDSELVSWMSPPKPPLELSVVVRPTDPLQAIGYMVEVPSSLPEAEYGEYFRGEVIHVDPKSKLMRISFDHRVIDPQGRNDSAMVAASRSLEHFFEDRQQDANAIKYFNGRHGGGAGEDGEDYAECNYFSDQVLWVSTINTRKRSAVPKPHDIVAALGYVVCVRSTRKPSSLNQQEQEQELASSATVDTLRNTLTPLNPLTNMNPDDMVLAPVAVSSRSGAVLEDDYSKVILQTGTVVRINEAQGQIIIRITHEENTVSSSNMLTVPFASIEVLWMEEPVPFGSHSMIARPRRAKDVIGCTVAVPALTPMDPTSVCEYGDYFIAVVSGITLGTGMGGDDASLPVDGKVDNDSVLLQLRYSGRKRSLFAGMGAGAGAGAGAQPQLIMTKTMNQSISHLLASLSDDAPQPQLQHEVTNSFSQSHSSRDLLLSPTRPHSAGEEADTADVVDLVAINQPLILPFTSPHLAWLNRPPPPVSQSLLPRPTNVYDAVGYGVQVRTQLPDQEEGDFFSGTVAYTDQRANAMFICFESAATSSFHTSGPGGVGSDLDIEKVAFDSADVAWMQASPTIETCTGCRIGIRHLVDYASGKYAYPEVGFVVGTVPAARQMVCLLRSELGHTENSEDDSDKGGVKVGVRTFVMDKRILPFDWLSVYPQPFMLAPVSRPASLQDCVGYVVQLEGHGDSQGEGQGDGQGEGPGEPLTALVIGLAGEDPANKKQMRVRFFVDHEFDDVEEIIPFAPSLKFFMHVPRT